jgi:transcriptional regulator with XRE-family HTH domain
MSTLHEIGSAVRVRRTEMGLTQNALARISGLSRSTINAVEKQTIGNLSIEKAERLLESIGLSMSVTPGHASPQPGLTKLPPSRTALERAALTASVSYGTKLKPKELEKALLTGEAPEAIRPHLQVLLDEAPMSLLGKVVDELHRKTRIEPAQVWHQMRRLACDLQCFRAIWR